MPTLDALLCRCDDDLKERTNCLKCASCLPVAFVAQKLTQMPGEDIHSISHLSGAVRGFVFDSHLPLANLMI